MIPASCQLLSNLDTGGIERETVDITRALVKAGGKPIVISGSGRMLPDMLRTGCRHILLDTSRCNPLSRLMKAWKIARIIHKNDLKILHARGVEQIAVAALALKFRPVKLIATVHDLVGKTPRDGQRLKKALVKFDHLVAVSNFMADQLKEIGIDASRVTLIPTGIDMARFDPDKVRSHRIVDLARKWRMPDGIPLILVPSRLAPSSGQAFLITTLALMKDLPFICLIPGDEAINPAHRAEVEQLITKLGLEEKVRFVGFCDDMPAAYRLADVVVTPALKPEPFGRVTIEAQAMGRPVVAADHGGPREAITPDVTGLLFTPGQSASLEKALRQALKMSVDDRAAMGHAARAHVLDHYTVERMCAETLKLYAATVDGAGKS